MHQSQTSGGNSKFPVRMGYTGTTHGGRAVDRFPGRRSMAEQHVPGDESTESNGPADRPASPSSPPSPWEPATPPAPSPWAPVQPSPWADPAPPPVPPPVVEPPPPVEPTGEPWENPAPDAWVNPLAAETEGAEGPWVADAAPAGEEHTPTEGGQSWNGPAPAPPPAWQVGPPGPPAWGTVAAPVSRT